MSSRRSNFAAMPRGPITYMGPSHLGKREVPIEWQRYRTSPPPRIDRLGNNAYGKPLGKIACNTLTSDPDVDEIPNLVQLYHEAKQIHAQRLTDINQAKDARNMDEISQPPAPRAYIFNPPSFKSLMASKRKEMDDHEHLHASMKGESKLMLIKNLPTKNEDRENSEEVKENIELMETIDENYQFAKQMHLECGNGVQKYILLEAISDLKDGGLKIYALGAGGWDISSLFLASWIRIERTKIDYGVLYM
ncbi:hypothetical protein Tco_1343295 [Tanacetum coccineum]